MINWSPIKLETSVYQKTQLRQWKANHRVEDICIIHKQKYYTSIFKKRAFSTTNMYKRLRHITKECGGHIMKYKISGKVEIFSYICKDFFFQKYNYLALTTFFSCLYSIRWLFTWFYMMIVKIIYQDMHSFL